MDKKMYGEFIVNEIINNYKSSEEYRNDARNFVYRWLMNIIYYKSAGVGDNFVKSVCDGISDEVKCSFVSDFEKWTDMRTKLGEIFDLLNDEHGRELFPQELKKC